MARHRSTKKYQLYKEAARAVVHHKIAEVNEHYQFPIKKVFIKNSRTRWGSCSSRGNLNFNYKIVFLRPDLQEYLIAHELCHLGEFNHSSKFWDLVAQTVPEYKKLRKEIRSMVLR
jgi:predicted metal-dependent hydrolase